MLKIIYLFRKNLVNVGFNLFDPLDGLKIPQQLEQSIKYKNKSYLSTVIGLAFRKLDVFGYYKFVTAVKNINLLPDRKGMIKQENESIFKFCIQRFSWWSSRNLFNSFWFIFLEYIIHITKN